MTGDEALIRQHREITLLAQAMLALGHAIGIDEGELWDRLRQRAGAADGQSQIDAIKERSRLDKLAAMRVTPTRSQPVSKYPPGWVLSEGEVTPPIGANSQASRHAAMAAAGHAGDGSDAHADQRPIRAAIYSTLEPTE